MKYLILILLTLSFHVTTYSQTIKKTDSNTIEHIEKDVSFIPYEKIFSELINLQPVAGKVAKVLNKTLFKDQAKFDLKEGKLYLLSSVSNRTVAALFLGQGSFAFEPPTEIEKDHLYRFYKTRKIKQNFNLLFFICADGTIEDLSNQLIFKELRINRKTNNIIRNCIKYISDEDKQYFNSGIINTFLNNEQNGLFYAHFSQENLHPLFYMVDPYKDEEVRFMRRIENFFSQQIPEVICQFDRQEDNKQKFIKERNSIKISHYDLDCTIDSDYNISAKTEIEFKPLKDTPSWFYLYLYSELSVDSAFWQNGKKVKYFKGEENNTLWIFLDYPALLSEKTTLKLYYHGDLIENDQEGFYIKSSSTWYPRFSGSESSATYDLTFHTPKDLEFISAGKKLSESIKNDVLTTDWIIPFPVQNVCFNIGDYKEYVTKDPRFPTVKVYINKNRTDFIEHYFGQLRYEGADNAEIVVANDMATSSMFFESVFGKAPVRNLVVSETPFDHGLAFPGFIHLGRFAFRGITPNSRLKGFDTVFRAHEVSHQWWGIGMDTETYHDQWIIEGLATFSGLWYLQRILKSSQEYFNLLDLWREEIINNRKYLFADGQESGPVWLGYRTSTSSTRNDFNLLIYKKSAWIFHMLRNMMLDLETMNDQRFRDMLRDLYLAYKGKRLSTQNLQIFLEKYFVYNMDWFFKQWIYGTKIPEYKIYHKTLNGPKPRSFSEVFHVEQTNVDNDFQMYILITLVLNENNKIRKRILVKGPITTFSIPELPSPPREVIFNDLNSVLCDLEYKNW